MLSLRLALPSPPAAEGGDMRAELRVLSRRQVVMALVLTTIGFGGVFTVFTYIVPVLRDVTHGSHGYVTAMLMLFGVGATIGNGVGGRLADRSVDRVLMTMLAIMAVTLLAFTVLMQWPVTAAVAILVGGIASFDFPPVDRTRGSAVLAAMRRIPEAKGCTVAQIALAWSLHRPVATSVIVGAKRVDQFTDNIPATDVSLDADDLTALDAVTKLPAEYLGWMLKRQGGYRA